MRLNRIAAVAGLVLLPSLAQAHVGFHADGLGAGLSHPFSGLDHLLAMIAVGVWAAHLGGGARLAVPLAFVVVLALGAVLGAQGLALPAVETAIAASVAVLGLMIAFEVKVPAAAAAALVGAFALFHGQTHGAEMPALSNPLAYGLGFVAGAIALHGLGFGLGMLKASRLASRLAGGAVAAAGLALAFVG